MCLVSCVTCPAPCVTSHLSPDHHSAASAAMKVPGDLVMQLPQVWRYAEMEIGKTYNCASNACVNFVLARLKSVPNFTLSC